MPRTVHGALLDGMRALATESIGRRLAWALVVGAGACDHGTTSRTGGTDNLAGSTASGGNETAGMGTGGTATGGTATGGTTPVNLCEVVSSLPTQGQACSTPGESQCLANGERCACERGIWYCNNACPDTEPTPNTSCSRGAACTYSNGDVGCACINLLWMCVGVSDCPSSMPTTGNACNDLTGIACDYPNSNPAMHFACVCAANADAGPRTWTCIQSGECPAVQPAYDPAGSCPGPAVCTYSTPPYYCGCLATLSPWICGPGGAGGG